MKNSILILVSILFMTVTILSGCQSTTTKEKNAEEKVQEAKNDLANAKTDLYMIRLDTISTFEQFKIEAEKVIVLQEKNIAEFKDKLTIKKKELNADYNEKLLLMENKNSELKRKLANYEDEGKVRWIIFKNEFNHDMNELGKAFNDLTVENVK